MRTLPDYRNIAESRNSDLTIEHHVPDTSWTHSCFLRLLCCTSFTMYKYRPTHIIQLCSGIRRGRVLNGKLYARRSLAYRQKSNVNFSA